MQASTVRTGRSRRHSLALRGLAAAGAVLASASVALSAYAAHAAQGIAQANLYIAAVFAFGHGLALVLLAPRAVSSRLTGVALAVLLLGTLMFSGALVSLHAFGVSLGIAPWGGTALMVGWLLVAVAAIRGA